VTALAQTRGRPAPAPEGGLDIVVTGTSSDAHTWNLVYLQLLLEELGHRVSMLGPTVPDGEVVAHCRTSRPDLLVVSSLNGHGYADGLRLIRTLRGEPELAALPAVIGGKLGIRGAQDAARVRDLTAGGFDAVFEDTGGAVVVGMLRSYLGRLAIAPGR
jgi:methylaspartate mutase sigma subunit